MSAHVGVTVGILTPETAITAVLNSPTNPIPVIRFATEVDARAEVALWFKDPVKQAAWLRELAAAAEDLANEVERRHETQVATS